MVKSTEELIEIRDEVYKKLYKAAEPSKDFEKMMDGENPYKYDRYELHFLENGKQLEIISDTLGNYDLYHYNVKKIRRTVLLGAAPSSNKEKVNQKREEVGLDPI